MLRTSLTLSALVFVAACAPVESGSRPDPALAGPAVKVKIELLLAALMTEQAAPHYLSV